MNVLNFVLYTFVLFVAIFPVSSAILAGVGAFNPYDCVREKPADILTIIKVKKYRLRAS